MKHNWEYKKLGEVCEILDSKRKPVTKKDRKTGQYPYYGAMGIQDYVDNYIFDGDYLLVGEDGAKWGANDKSAFQVHGKCWVNNHAHILKVNEDLTNSAFVEHYLVGKDLSTFITGAVVPKLTQASLVSIPIPVPPLPIQEQIVAELDKVSEIIEKKKQQLKELDSLAQSIFYDMFGDPVENEKGWEVKRLGEQCSELRYGTSRPAVENGKYGYIRMGNLTISGHLDLSDLKYIDIPENEIEKCLVKKGDVMFNRTNSLDLIGKTCVFDLDEPMVIAGYIIRVRLKPTLHPRYVVSLFNTQVMKMVLRKMAKGAVNQANINSKELSSIKIPIPPLSLQQAFAEKVEAIERQKELITASIKEAQTLFDSRMDYWFGEN